ncbi:hypothetical protein TNCV_2151371 [Trichonephila clavipes]|uniref:Uncharacterized protein n=1 Tax=Trichonephila clavipes TaxID=2585209 RepID=A0A8X6R2A6_TRICX|nr:hypothetical protein TNCV_2151371 [Trichonephila clavipes]
MGIITDIAWPLFRRDQLYDTDIPSVRIDFEGHMKSSHGWDSRARRVTSGLRSLPNDEIRCQELSCWLKSFVN